MSKKIATALIFFPLLLMGFSGESNAKKSDPFELSGYLMLDYDFFDESLLEGVTEESTSNELGIRRARLSLKSDFNNDWKGKFQLGFADGVEVKDAYLKYKGWSFADVIVGQQKENFGLEKLIGSRKLLMIERSMSTEAFAPGRSLGVSAEGELSSLLWQLGYYQPSGNEAQSAVTGRVVWLPWQEDTSLLHLGAAFSERDYSGNEFRLNETLEVNFSDSLLEGKRIDADTVSLQGLEALWLQDRFIIMAEWQQTGVTSIEQKTYDYEGGYVQFGYQLSGGSREYKNGKLGNSSKSGWELTGRYSELTLKEEGESAETYAIGFNYTLSKNFKFMGDYIKTEYFEDGANIGDGDAVSVRIQYSF